jgi:hypothetical protein
VRRVSVSKQMRAAWSRRSGDELLRAYFLEELTAEGSRAVAELVVENYGPVEALVRSFEIEQGEVVATVPVRSVDVDASVKGERLPLMWGQLVLTSTGIGFIPRGHDDELGADDLNRLGDLAFGHPGAVLGTVGDALWSGLKRTMQPVASRDGVALPVPLLAKLEPNALWMPHAVYDHVLWGPDFAELVREGERLISLTPMRNAGHAVAAWAATYQIALTPVAPAPFLR